MKHTTHTLCMLLLLAALHSTCNAQMSERTDLASAGTNGGFETATGSLPVNWYFYTPRTVPSGTFTITLDTRDAAEGKQCLVFHVTQCSDKGGRFSPGFFNEFAATPGATYRIRFKVKNKGAAIKVQLSGVSAKKGSKVTEAAIPDTGGNWQEVTYDFTMPAEFARLRFQLNILSAGTVKVDAFSLEPLVAQP